MASTAQQTWLNAQKARRAVLKEIEQLKKDAGDKNEEAHLHAVEDLLSGFRLACVQTIFLDFKFSAEHDVEGTLWQIHSFVNNEYRGLLGRLKVPQQLVTKRKVERMYAKYLRTAQYFYKGYIQRLWARYDLPQLERIARCIRVDPLETGNVERLEAASVQPEMLKSCHATLIHLGDLSRYRAKARQKLHASETALTYYAIAQDVNPDSGFAHHQMGVVHLDDKNHLEIVYHFYRAWAVESPHPNAANNLEVEFKSLLLPSTPGRRSGPPDAHEAFKSWFVRLHARFFKGEVFSQHAELEEEVLHRFEMILKNPGVIPLLLKMVLINISAYHIAKTKVERKWTLTASRSCQFILRLNVRAILTLTRLLQTELRDVDKSAPPAQDGRVPGSAGGSSAGTSGSQAYAENIIPLLRIYVAWICAYRADLIKYEEHLEPYIHEMYRTLAQSATRLVQEFGGRDLAASPYLLFEDLEVLGLSPIDHPGLPSPCRLQRLADRDVRKPRAEDLGRAPKGSREETMSRVYDILSCIFSLASDPAFPLVADAGDGESLEAVTISYQEGAHQPQPSGGSTAGPSSLLDASVKDLTSRLTGFQAGVEQSGSGLSASLTKSGELPPVATGDERQSYAASSLGGQTIQVNAEQQGHVDTAAEIEAEFSIDRDMYNMVNDFLAPPEASSRQPAHEETSYGMHSSTADEIFGALQSKSPTPRSATGKAFPTLPWNYFISPTPHRPDQVGVTGSPDGTRAPRTYGGSPSGWGNSTLRLEDPFVAPVDTRLRRDISSLFDADYPAALGDSTRGGNMDLDFLQQTSANFTGSAVARASGHQPTSSTSSSQPSTSRQGWNTVAGSNRRMSQPLNDTYGETLDQSSKQANQLGARYKEPPFASTAFSQQTSSLPPVNSPWGLPGAQAGAQAGPFPRYRQASLSSGYYSQPNNAFQGTTGAMCNGNVYNATTAFGRGPVATKDDPTHFRNAVKRTHVAPAVQAADDYDRAVLASAMVDEDGKKPRAKGRT
ncbi:Protein SMG7 [Pleurostoma richardsiae]|uniref:Nonsense-mediated mRNA decay factor n=1 Tax=Pleurostoma richardsiae TaxID=41990 RepID=A0AA38VV42_9PEZI|nr:Protein SMG7 [Pleurostoma richardsiae]